MAKKASIETVGEIQLIPLKDIKPNESNPRTIKDEKFAALLESLKEFPEMLFKRPLIIDENMVILGGNQRFKAAKELKIKQVPVIIVSDWSEDQKKAFIIKDNLQAGEWDQKALRDLWDEAALEHWGLQLNEWGLDADELGTDFSLPDGAKSPFQQMTFMLADEQAMQIKNALADIKDLEEFKYVETFGNENANGNALYLLIMQWAEQRK